jgi:uncharacterized repeat protein (TIGR03837 family)
MKVPASCDIFCTVIDNYGDIGVSWRLARQLAAEYGIAVRLWVDRLAALQRIWPTVDVARPVQHICIQGESRRAEVEVREWTAAWEAVEPAAVAIEAFGCRLPPEYVQAMAARVPRSLWINLEYLSAEDWVTDCHGLASPQPDVDLPKYFFFPGFAAGTGGLLLERDLPRRRQMFQDDPAAPARFLADCGLGELSAELPVVQAEQGLLVSLFSYRDIPLTGLFDVWSKSKRPVVCLVPEGRLLDAIGEFFGTARPAGGAVLRRGALAVAVLPFLAQDDYDRLLWSCDLNFVRGEDSFVRAQWAGRPFVWRIYPQAEGAHLLKLQAFLDLYSASLPPRPGAALADFWRAWNGCGDIADAWRALEPWLPALRDAAPGWPTLQAERGNLAAALVLFCANHV